jgi:hypothetical protein
VRRKPAAATVASKQLRSARSWDFGTNAARAASLLEDIDDAATPDKTEQPVKKVQKANKTTGKDAQSVKR